MLDGGALGALGVFLVALIALTRTLLLDRAAFDTQAAEIRDLRSEHVGLRAHVTALEMAYDEQRSLKHKAMNDLAKTVMALNLVQELAGRCTCQVLEPLHEVIDHLIDELDTLRNRRADDPPMEGTP